MVWADNCREEKAPKTKCVMVLSVIFDAINVDGFSGSPTEDWILGRQVLERSGVDELKRTGDLARYLCFLRRGSLIEHQHRSFRGKDDKAPFMETRRLLQISLTRIRYYAYVLSALKNVTLDVIFDD